MTSGLVLNYGNGECFVMGYADDLLATRRFLPAEVVLDIPQRQRAVDIEHHRQADDLWARFELMEKEERLTIPAG